MPFSASKSQLDDVDQETKLMTVEKIDIQR